LLQVVARSARPGALAVGVLALLLGGCSGGRALQNPVEFTLTNRTRKVASGVVLRFDRELERVDRLGPAPFRDVRLRVAAADTLELGGGELLPGRAVRLRVIGRGGAPHFVEGRWLRATGPGPTVKHDETETR